jgi:hypothetical protein
MNKIGGATCHILLVVLDQAVHPRERISANRLGLLVDDGEQDGTLIQTEVLNVLQSSISVVRTEVAELVPGFLGKLEECI